MVSDLVDSLVGPGAREEDAAAAASSHVCRMLWSQVFGDAGDAWRDAGHVGGPGPPHAHVLLRLGSALQLVSSEQEAATIAKAVAYLKISPLLHPLLVYHPFNLIHAREWYTCKGLLARGRVQGVQFPGAPEEIVPSSSSADDDDAVDADEWHPDTDVAQVGQDPPAAEVPLADGDAEADLAIIESSGSFVEATSEVESAEGGSDVVGGGAPHVDGLFSSAVAGFSAGRDA